MKPSLLSKLEQLTQRLEEVGALLNQENATSDMDQYRKLTREHAELEPLVAVHAQWTQANEDIRAAREMLARVGRLPPVPAAGALPAPFTTANQFADAIDWAQAENVREGSALKGQIDLANIAVMGQSCGGVQAIDAARDPRVKTLGVWNSGLFPDPKRMWPVAAARVNKTDLAHLKVPAIFITGAPSDVAYKNADDDFERMSGVPLVRAWREKTGHSGTYRETLGGAFAPVAVAWLRWHLQGQEDAARMFKGTACGLCQQTDWHIRTKHID